jgi:hypothetical protein
MRRRARRREDTAIDIVKGLAGLVLMLILLGSTLRGFADYLAAAFGVLLLLGIVAFIWVGVFKLSRRQRRTSNGTVEAVDLQTLSPIGSWHSSSATPAPEVIVTRPVPRADAAPRITVSPPPSSRPRVTVQDLEKVDWFQFEKIMALLFEARGNRVDVRGGANPDGGIDLIVYRATEKTAVQCKHWVWKVGVRHFRDFFGGMKSEGFERGIFVALSGCTNEAREFAARNNITIIEQPQIGRMLQEADVETLREIRSLADDPTKHCPKCGAPMVLRVAESGPSPGSRFWGCSTFGRTRCNGKIRID